MSDLATLRQATRVRVGIDVPCYNPIAPALRNPDADDSQGRLHFGHVRTLYLGRLIADTLGLPYHIRVDGKRRNESDAIGVLMDITNTTQRLGIAFDKFYWVRQTPPSKDYITGTLGDRADAFWLATDLPFIENAVNIAAAVDDLIDHYPSVMVRGMEFADPERFAGQFIGTISNYVRTHKHLYASVGREKLEVNVPLVTKGGDKLGKSTANMIDVDIVRSVSPELMKRFLIATAMWPEDPLLAMNTTDFNIAEMSQEPYEWSWDTWAELVRMDQS